MPKHDREDRDRRGHRSRSFSDSDEHSRRREDYRNRDRPPSRDAPRKRRSVIRDYEGTRRDRKDSRDYEDHQRRRRRSHSADQGPRRSRSPEPFRRAKGPLLSQKDAFQGNDLAIAKPDAVPEKQKPNFGNSGKLAAASNTIQTAGRSIVLKYHEPSEARKPSAKDRWRMYVFKGDEIVDTLELAEQSCWLFGREAAVVDVLIEHSSCSKQHAVIQFRYLEKRNEFGDRKGKVRPYVLDLESANGTTVNEGPIPEAKYVELRDKDVVKFGHSSREYVMQLPPLD